MMQQLKLQNRKVSAMNLSQSNLLKDYNELWWLLENTWIFLAPQNFWWIWNQVHHTSAFTFTFCLQTNIRILSMMLSVELCVLKPKPRFFVVCNECWQKYIHYVTKSCEINEPEGFWKIPLGVIYKKYIFQSNWTSLGWYNWHLSRLHLMIFKTKNFELINLHHDIICWSAGSSDKT